MQAEEELQQAAAVVARLTNSQSLVSGGTSPSGDAVQRAAKAAKSALTASSGLSRPEAISDLEKQVAEANLEALTFSSDDDIGGESASAANGMH